MNFGDARGDVHPAFTLMVTSLLRNHNKMAATLASFHPGISTFVKLQLGSEIRPFKIWKHLKFILFEGHISYTVGI